MKKIIILATILLSITGNSISAECVGGKDSITGQDCLIAQVDTSTPTNCNAAGLPWYVEGFCLDNEGRCARDLLMQWSNGKCFAKTQEQCVGKQWPNGQCMLVSQPTPTPQQACEKTPGSKWDTTTSTCMNAKQLAAARKRAQAAVTAANRAVTKAQKALNKTKDVCDKLPKQQADFDAANVALDAAQATLSALR